MHTSETRRARDARGGSIDLARRTRLAHVTLGVLLGLSAACGGMKRAETEEPPITDPGTLNRIIPQSAAPQIDLPGRISLFVQVTKQNGAPVDTLADSDFRIYENGQRVSETESGQRTLRDPQSFRSFSHLLIDRSNSVQNARPAIQDGARLYVNTVLDANPNAFIKLSWFDGSVDIHPIAGHEALGFTDDRAALLAAIDDLFDEPPFNGSTNLYGAILAGADDLDEEDVRAAALGIENRTLTVVTFTDGTHQAGPAVTLQQVVDRLTSTVNGRRVYSAFSIGLEGEVDQSVLTAIGPDGSTTGALVGAGGSESPLIAAFRAIGEGVSRLANSFYVLSYCSPKTFGTHELRISANAAQSNGDVVLSFDATGFGAGCGFLDVYTHPEIGATQGGSPSPFTRFSDAVEVGGKVLAVGWHGGDCAEPGCGAATDAFFVRFTADPAQLVSGEARRDGRLDTTFGFEGQATFGTAAPISGASSVLALPDGTLLVGGWTRPSTLGGPADAALWRFDPNGGFLEEVVLPNTPQVDQFITDLTLGLGSTRVFACGTRGTTATTTAVWSLDLSLQLDLAFDGDGVRVYPETSNTTRPFARAAAYDPRGAGRLYVVGDGDPPSIPANNGGRDLQVLALDPVDGSLDPGFSGDGVAHAMSTFGVAWPGRPVAAVVDSLGALTVGGTIVAPTGATPALQPAAWRFLETGDPDLSFRGSPSSVWPNRGIATLRTPSTSNPEVDFGRDSVIEDLALGPDGRALLAGRRANRELHEDMAHVVFATDGAVADYNVVGFLIEDGAAADDAHDRAQVVLVHSTGAIWTLGHSKDRRDPVNLGDDGPDVPVVWVDRDPGRSYLP